MQDKNVREVLEGAFDAIHGWRKREKSPGYWEHHPLWFRFRRFLDVEAYLDAAMMLVPEGAGFYLNRYWIASADGPVWSCEICTGGIPSNPRRVFDDYDADHPAIAVASAALKAKEQP